MEDYYLYIKALHLIFIVTWFAGLFYIPRLFVYQIEAHQEEEPAQSILLKQLKLMTRRLWFIISWPSAVLATAFALMLIYINPDIVLATWMQIKLGFVVLLIIYHLKTHFIFKELENNVIKWTSNGMRLYNEGATLILFAVIFLVILQSAINWIYGLIGLFALAVLLMILFKIYKRYRKQ